MKFIAERDLELAKVVAAYPWVVDDITEVEQRALSDLNGVPAETAARMLEMIRPPEGLVDDPDQWNVRSLVVLARLGPDMFEELADEPWFADGLDDKDEALLEALPTIRNASPDLYADIVWSRHIQSATISLPLAGEVDIWVFQSTAFHPSDNLTAMVEDAVRATERLVDAPFPTNRVIMLIPIVDLDTDHGIYGGLHWGRFITATRYEPWPVSRGVVYHEVAHYYFRGGLGPAWLVEGGAEFMKAYTNDRVGIESLEDRMPTARNLVRWNCSDQGIINIAHLNERSRAFTYPPLGCNYNMGEYFLLNLFETLGEEATGRAIRTLYWLSTGEGRPVTEKEIYRAFREQTPRQLVAEFHDLYRRLHGGAFLDD